MVIIWEKMLLADVFEKFIDTCLNFYRLDPCHYSSSPGMSWDAMLKMTGVRLEKIVDIYMYLYIEKGLRGGISYIAKRCSEANNKYIKIMILQNRQSFYHTLIWIIYTAGEWVVIFLMVFLSG